jgi:glycerol-3-phosphate responsive antiterminator
LPRSEQTIENIAHSARDHGIRSLSGLFVIQQQSGKKADAPTTTITFRLIRCLPSIVEETGKHWAWMADQLSN